MPATHHVGITVADLDRAVEFYSDTFDFEVSSRFSVSGAAFETGVDVPDAAAQFAHLDAGDCRLELVSYEPTGEDAAAEAVNDTGAKHVGFEVDDIEAFYADLDDGVETISEPQTTASGTTILFVEDPEGNLIELLEPSSNN